MKWLWVLLLIVIAIGLAFVGLLASADPEGRGGKIASILFGSALAVLVLATSLAMRFW